MKDNKSLLKSLRKKIDDLDPDDLEILQQIARDQVIEPFAGRRSLETIQKTRSGMEKSLGKIKDVSSKAGGWIAKTKLADQSQKKLTKLVKEFKEKPTSETIAGFLDKFNQRTEEIQQIAKKGYSGIEETTKKLTLSFVEKGLEILLYEDSDRWILKRANKCLNRTDIKELEQIIELSQADREQLVGELYPYDSQLFKKYVKGFDLSVNIGLGAVVATNIPGTGIAVSLVNMGKTLVKIGNRLNIMSAIYGRRISSPEALFKVSASIIRSIDDWESNDAHQPLETSLLDDLYIARDDDDGEGFQELLNSVIRKEAYIAIPGVGMISLGKINMDDLKMDMVIMHLVQNYAEKIQQVERYGEACVNQIISDFKGIYRIFYASGYFKEMRGKITSEQSDKKGVNWKDRLKTLAGPDMTLEESSLYLDQNVKLIFLSTHFLEDPLKTEQVQESVKNVINQYSIKD